MNSLNSIEDREEELLEVHRDSLGRLHNENGPALVYKNAFSVLVKI